MQTRQLDEFAVAQRRQFEQDLGLNADQREQLGMVIFAWCVASTAVEEHAHVERIREKLIKKVRETA
jgi:hypothetical protein